MKSIVAMTASALFSAMTIPAAAQPVTGAPRVVVSYADLDLSSAAGRAALEGRVERAVASVCPARPLAIELAKRQAYRACNAQAWAGARPQLARAYGARQLAETAIQVGGD